MQKRRPTLLAALLLSVLLHLLLVGGPLIGLPELPAPPDEILARHAPVEIRRVRLQTPPAPKPASHPQARTVARKKPSPETPSVETPAPTVVPETAATASEPAPAETPPAPPLPPEPAPAFPIQVSAVLEARYNDIPFRIRQHWVMEGLRYAIDQDAQKFGFRFRITSEGRISPEGGLQPERYRLLLNDKVRNLCDYSGGSVRYGRAENPRTDPMPAVPQDMASLPFHVAVTFSGQPQHLYVCTGNNVYRVQLAVDAEETLKLPAGTLRTLHLKGQRYDARHGQLIEGYDVWLAPDYLNYPVKFSGQSGNGDRLEFRVRSLEIEGQTVLGAAGDDDTTPETVVIPDWLRERSRQEGLNNPDPPFSIGAVHNN